MTIKIATTTGGYANIKTESVTNDANLFIDTENFDLFGRFNNHFDLLNEKTIIINTSDYDKLRTAEPGTLNYELWYNPHITWVVQEQNEWETIRLDSINIQDSSLNIISSSRQSEY